MNEKKSKIFEYTEKHAGEYIDQFLKIKIIVDQENYDNWRSIEVTKYDNLY